MKRKWECPTCGNHYLIEDDLDEEEDEVEEGMIYGSATKSTVTITW